jgi:arylsulfatase A-like enzyme
MANGKWKMANVGRLLFVFSICHLPFSICHAAPPPNIIHIVADDVGYDDLSCYGAKKIKTPNLDRLAAQGMRLTSFYAPAPTCTPSRAALMTGCYAQRVGLPRVLFPSDDVGLADSEITIAELLKTRGYATAVIGKWHLGHHVEHLPTRHGFDLFFGIPYPNDHGPERDRSKQEAVPFPPIPLIRNQKIVEQPAKLETCPDRFVEEAIKFITDNKDKPFFLHLANIETHTPWFVPERFRGQSADGAYGDAVQCMDWMVGQVMETLDRLHLADSTLVVFTSDNGPLWQRGKDLERIYGNYGTVDTSRPHLLRAGKYQSRWEGGTRVPAIFRWPGKIPAGKESNELAAGFDLYNTFAAAGGAEVPNDRVIDGVNLMPIITAQQDAKPPHDAFYYYAGYTLTGVRSGPWKLVYPGKPPPYEDQTLLYNVQDDPGETKDLSAQYPDIVDRLETLAKRAREDLGDERTHDPGKNRRAPSHAKPAASAGG